MRSASSAFGEVNKLRAEKKELLAAITRLETTIYARDETPPCPFCGHREHRDDICEQDLGEHGECQCADTRPRSDADIVRAAYDRLDATNIEQAAEIARLRVIEEAARAVAETWDAPVYVGQADHYGATAEAMDALRAALATAYREEA